MNETIENSMTDEQKKVYYVTKIARLSSEEHKLMIGAYVSGGVFASDILVHVITPSFNNLTVAPVALVSAGIAIYYLIAFYHNIQQQNEAYSELAELNKDKVKTK